MKAPRIVLMYGQEYLTITRTGQVDWTMNPDKAIVYDDLETARQDAARFHGTPARETFTSNGGRLQTFDQVDA
jgi:hypothetical protein